MIKRPSSGFLEGYSQARVTWALCTLLASRSYRLQIRTAMLDTGTWRLGGEDYDDTRRAPEIARIASRRPLTPSFAGDRRPRGDGRPLRLRASRMCDGCDGCDGGAKATLAGDAVLLSSHCALSRVVGMSGFLRSSSDGPSLGEDSPRHGGVFESSSGLLAPGESARPPTHAHTEAR